MTDKRLPICGEIPLVKGDMKAACPIALVVDAKGETVEFLEHYWVNTAMIALSKGFPGKFAGFGQCTYFANA